MDGTPWGSLSTIRVRLTAALAAALLPVLILGILQSAMSFRREGVQLREDLAAHPLQVGLSMHATIDTRSR